MKLVKMLTEHYFVVQIKCEL